MSIIDDIKEQENVVDAQIKIEGLYNTLYCDLRDASAPNVQDDELKMAVGEVVFCVTKAVNYYPGGKYSKLLHSLLSQLNNAKVDVDWFQEKFSPQFYMLGEGNIANYVQSYMNSDDYFSDTIRKELKKVKEDEPKLMEDEQEDSGDGTQLDNQQLVILFTTMLGITLDSSTNKSALSTLISKVSGRSPGGIRKFTIANNKFYTTEKGRQDLSIIASLLDSLRPDLSQKIRNDLAV